MALILMLAYRPPGDGLWIYQNGTLLYATYRHDLGESLSLADSFSCSGTYLFVPDGFEDVQGIFEKVEPLLHSGSDGSKFLWVSNPDDALVDWLCCRLECGGITADAGGADERCLSAPARLGTSRYSLFLRRGVRVRCDGNQFILTPPDERTVLTVQAAGAVLQASGNAIIQSGQICFTTADCVPQEDIVRRMDVRIQYTRSINRQPFDFENARRGGIQTLSSPFLSNGVISFVCAFNPAMLFNPAYTYFEPSPGVALQTGLPTPAGRGVQLLTVEGSKLVLQNAVRFLYIGQGQSQCARHEVYLSPHGSFLPVTPPQERGLRILCGLSGTEYVQLPQGGVINFYSGFPAYFNGDNPPSGLSQTAAIAFPNGTQYISQPQDAPLFGRPTESLLEFLDIPTLVLSDAHPPVAMLPYLMAQGEYPPSELEAALIVLRRSAWLNPSVQTALCTDETIVGVTPHGMAVGVTVGADKAGDWAWLGLANTGNIPTQLPNMCFTDVSPAMRYAYQDTSLRLCYETPEDIIENAGVSDDFNFTVDGWTFCTSPKDWWRRGEHPAQTVMLVQFSTGQPLAQWLAGVPAFEQAVRMAHEPDGSAKTRYQEFLRVTEDPLFQGVVVLNCPVAVNRAFGGYMDDLAPVLDSIDLDALSAHHIIIYRSQIDVQNRVVTLKGASVSALVDYRQETAAPYSGEDMPPDYDFSTAEFLITVKERCVADIESKSDLLINKLLEAPAQKTGGSAGNNLVIAGRLQTGESAPRYTYSLLEPGEYAIAGSCAQLARIDAVELTTDKIGSEFHLNGRLCFEYNEEADLFSYGEMPDETSDAAGLRFDNLTIGMTGTGKQRLMQMGYGKLLLRCADSIPRKNGFAERFGAFPKRFSYSLDALLPNGYVSIETPVQQGEIAAPWFGIEYEISLGGLGALAGPDGLMLKLLAAWTPGESPNRYFGVLLPGADLLKLQGVFQIGFSAISLQTTSADYALTYTLIMHQFAVRLLGLTFPPGENKLFLFADGNQGGIGWYAAYMEG